MSATTDLPPSLAERFWSHSAGRESEDLPEPERSVAVVRNFLSALERLDVPVLIAMLRRAEVEGDLSYASPEQVRAENLDARAIVFSLGVVLFERLTGRHPFGAENNRPRRVDRIRRGEMGSGVNSFPTIPGGIRTVLVRAMSPFAEERWPDLKEFRTALRTATPDEAAPPPKLPGASAVPSATSEEITKVVRMPTEFGQELMKVVAEHDDGSGPSAGTGAPPPTPSAPPQRRTGRQSAQAEPAPAVVATAAAAAVPVVEIEAAAMEPAKPAKPAMGKLPPAPPGATEEADRPSAPRFERDASAKRRPATIPEMLATPARGTRAGVIAVVGAVVGAAIALTLVFVMRPPAGTREPAAPVAAGAQPAIEPAPATRIEEPPKPAVAPAVEPSRPAVDPAPTPPPAPAPAVTAAVEPPKPAPAPVEPAPTPASSGLDDQIKAAVTGCLAAPTKTQAFGFSAVFKDKTAGKLYFDGDALTKGEKTCITGAVKGMTADDAPAAADMLFMFRVNAQGMTLKSRALK